MNIITNNCLGGFLYRDILKQQYANPFIWTSIDIKSYNTMFINYYNINFNNYIIKTENNTKDSFYHIIIDNNYDIRFGHILFSNSDNIPRLVNNGFSGDIYYNKPWEYINNNYLKRLKRMVEPPVFIWFDLYETHNYDIQNIANNLKRNIIILTVDEKFINTDFCKIIYIQKQNWNNSSSRRSRTQRPSAE